MFDFDRRVKGTVVYHRLVNYRSVTIIKIGRGDYQVEMHDLYSREYCHYSCLKAAKKEATRLLKN